MAFNIGLSGLRAASADLDVTGNNIANASTVGFKESRVQFGDLYANGFLSSGSAPIGDGVNVQDVKQSFGQGNISFTDNGLDMAISGDGFFMLNNGGEIRYSRAGQFSIDKDGYVVNNQSMRVQGYTADGDGNLSGVRGDLQIETANLAPRRTTNLQTDVNLDSRQTVLENRVAFLIGGEGSNPSAAETSAILGESFTLTYQDGTTQSQTLPTALTPGQGADYLAELLNGIEGINASARTEQRISGANLTQLNNALGQPDFQFSVSVAGASDVTFDSGDVGSPASLENLAAAITAAPGLSSVSAEVDGGNLVLRDSRGQHLSTSFDSVASGDSGSVATDGFLMSLSADDSINSATSPDAGSDIVAYFNNGAANPSVTNAFNPIDQRTYNHATSTTIYDSLGNSHELTQFFVKDQSPGNGVGQSQWSVYLQIDGEMVAGTDQSPYTALFNQDGSLESINGNTNGEIIVTDWVPKNAAGDPNGADGPPINPGNVVSPIPEPPTSSAFVLNLGDATQYGASFGVNDQQQNGYSTGRLSGLDVSDQGVIFARYTNGQSKSLGQVALAAFNNTDGLSPTGDTSWVETFESGQPIIGAPDTGTLGSIKASSVEESNVDLSAELVNLIIAQRNYQANAKTIETSDSVTQTIINLR
ncbi:flagellar hook protein FlgE [Marinobacter fonticola]|uniref:flagellar hook protein FlgE n=1 Tax=Marinobacter fonticola TaxID=2603215 RepID=UPI0011E7AFB2|nr:flagellar hook protein FlgE [Marinobacter fonticola]